MSYNRAHSATQKIGSLNQNNQGNTLNQTMAQNSKQSCCASACGEPGNLNRTFHSGRNKFIILYTITRLVFKFIWGIFDEISDWYYFGKNQGKFENIIIEELMLFFLVAQFIVQIIAWAIILGEIKIEATLIYIEDKDLMQSLRAKNKKIRYPLYMVKDMTKMETKWYIAFVKAVLYRIYNILVHIWYTIKSLHQGFIMMLLQVTKLSPFAIHIYFENKYQVVLTETLFQRFQERKRILQDGKFTFKNPKNKDNDRFKGIEIDANIKPNLATFLFEADLERYLRMADTIEAIFEALPMSILQFINNQLKYDSIRNWTLEDQLFFLSSFMTVFIYTISLIHYLFRDDADTLWVLDYHLARLKKQGEKEQLKEQKKKQNISFKKAQVKEYDKFLYNEFKFPKNFVINQPKDMVKFQFCQPLGLQKIETLSFQLDNFATDLKYILETTDLLFPQIQSSQTELSLNKCNLKIKHLQFLIEQTTKLKSSTLILNLNGNPLVFKERQDFHEKQILHNFNRIESLSRLNLDFGNCDLHQNDSLQFLMEVLQKNDNLNEINLNLTSNNLNNTDYIYQIAEKCQLQLEQSNQSLIQKHVKKFDLNLKENFLRAKQMSDFISYISQKYTKLESLKLDLSRQFLNNQIPQSTTQLESKQALNLQKVGTLSEKEPSRKPSFDLENPYENQQISIINIKKSTFSLTLENLDLDISSNKVNDDILSSLGQQFIQYLTNLKNLTINLSYNSIGDEGIQKFAQNGLNELNLTNIDIDLSNQISTTSQLTLQSLKQLFSNQKSCETLILNFQNNIQLKNSVFYNNKLEINKTDENQQAKGGILQQFEQITNLNGNFLILKVIQVGTQDPILGFTATFEKDQELWIDLHTKRVFKPEFKKETNITLLQPNKAIQFNKNQVTIGRLSQTNDPPIIQFNSEDKFVSRKQANITSQVNDKGQESYYIENLANLDSSTQFKLTKKSYYQLFTGCRISINRGKQAAYIEILAIGKNDYIPLKTFKERSSKKLYSWQFLENQQKPDDDDLTEDDKTEQGSDDYQFGQQQSNLSETQILVQLYYDNNYADKTQFIFDVSQDGPNNNMEITYIPEHQIKVGINFKSQIKLKQGTFFNSKSYADLHCVIGYKLFDLKDTQKAFWFLKIPDEIDEMQFETFLDMHQKSQNHKFLLQDGMQLNMGFTTFQVKVSNPILEVDNETEQDQINEEDHQSTIRNPNIINNNSKNVDANIQQNDNTQNIQPDNSQIFKELINSKENQLDLQNNHGESQQNNITDLKPDQVKIEGKTQLIQ